MTYATMKALLRAVLTGKGLRESDNFDIMEDGAIIQSEGFSIVLAGIEVVGRSSGRVRDFAVRYDVHVTRTYTPDQYATADDAIGDTVEDVAAGLEEIEVTTQMANGIAGMRTASASAQHFEQGVVHVTIPLTVTYRRT